MKLKNFNDLLSTLFSDIQYIAKQTAILYPKMKEKARSQEVKNVIDQHLKEIRVEAGRIAQFSKDLGIATYEETSNKSLFTSAQKLLQDNEASPLLDAAMVTNIQQIEHAEAAAYSSLEAFAEMLDLNELRDFLDGSTRELSKAEDALESLEKHAFYSPTS